MLSPPSHAHLIAEERRLPRRGDSPYVSGAGLGDLLETAYRTREFNNGVLPRPLK